MLWVRHPCGNNDFSTFTVRVDQKCQLFDVVSTYASYLEDLGFSSPRHKLC